MPIRSIPESGRVPFRATILASMARACANSLASATGIRECCRSGYDRKQRADDEKSVFQKSSQILTGLVRGARSLGPPKKSSSEPVCWQSCLSRGRGVTCSNAIGLSRSFVVVALPKYSIS